MLVMSLCLFSSCSKDDEGESAEIPSGLIGTWRKTSGADKYDMSFTFKSDGTGTGSINHNRILSYRSYSFKYSYKSSGKVVCDAICVSVDESGEDTQSTTLTFTYNGGSTLSGIDTGNTAFAGCTFKK